MLEKTLPPACGAAALQPSCHSLPAVIVSLLRCHVRKAATVRHERILHANDLLKAALQVIIGPDTARNISLTRDPYFQCAFLLGMCS